MLLLQYKDRHLQHPAHNFFNVPWYYIPGKTFFLFYMRSFCFAFRGHHQSLAISDRSGGGGSAVRSGSFAFPPPHFWRLWGVFSRGKGPVGIPRLHWARTCAAYIAICHYQAKRSIFRRRRKVGARFQPCVPDFSRFMSHPTSGISEREQTRNLGSCFFFQTQPPGNFEFKPFWDAHTPTSRHESHIIRLGWVALGVGSAWGGCGKAAPLRD